MSLRDYGWTDVDADSHRSLSRSGLEPGRVVLASAGIFRVVTANGERNATLAGALRHAATRPADLPAVGDWVAIRCPSHGATARIEQLLERRTKLSRKAAGRRSDEQVVAANIDVVCIVMGLDGDFNLRRLERMLTAAWESGGRPLVLLNKLDLCDEPGRRYQEVTRVAPDLPVRMVSCSTGAGMEDIPALFPPRETAVLIGSSGVGKSTLINRLLGARIQRTDAVRSGDDRGRHTTTHRELFRMPGGGLLIDNPGIRELQPWSEDRSLSRTFDEVAELAAACRFRDCAHESETGCAVLEAVELGRLSPSRLASYRALRKEIRYLELRKDESARHIEKKRWRAIHREMRRSGRHRGR